MKSIFYAAGVVLLCLCVALIATRPADAMINLDRQALEGRDYIISVSCGQSCGAPPDALPYEIS